MDPPRYPVPIIYGPKKPRIALRLGIDGEQHPRSSTNENLTLHQSDFSDGGTFTLERFLMHSRRCTAEHQADRCPFVAQRIPNPRRGMDYEADTLIVAKPTVDPDACPGLCALRDMCGRSEAQKRFLWRYITANALGAPDEWTGDWGNVYEFAKGIRHLLLQFAALIPEVWLNQFERVEDYVRNPGRVDFVLLAEGSRCVIEIDGPSHYAEYRRGEYQVSEQLYTKNLRIERALRRKGWEIHRFSNWEVMNATDGEFSEMISILPGSHALPF